MLRCPFVRRIPLRRFFLKTRIFGPRASPSTTRDDPRIGHEGRAGEHLAAVPLDQQHPIEAHLGPGLAVETINDRPSPGATFTWCPPPE